MGTSSNILRPLLPLFHIKSGFAKYACGRRYSDTLLPSTGRRLAPSVVTGNKRLTRLFPGESLVIRQLTSRIAQSRSTGRLTSTYPRVNLRKRDMPTQAYLPDRDPVIPRELVHNPLAAESPKTAILLASEGTRR